MTDPNDGITEWHIEAASRRFIGPVTVADDDGDAVGDFKLALLPHYLPAPDPAVHPELWHTADTRNSSRGLIVGPGSTFGLLAPGVYLLWPTYVDPDSLTLQPVENAIGKVFVRGPAADPVDFPSGGLDGGEV